MVLLGSGACPAAPCSFRACPSLDPPSRPHPPSSLRQAPPPAACCCPSLRRRRRRACRPRCRRCRCLLLWSLAARRRFQRRRPACWCVALWVDAAHCSTLFAVPGAAAAQHPDLSTPSQPSPAPLDLGVMSLLRTHRLLQAYARYKEKRKRLHFGKKIRYQTRKVRRGSGWLSAC